MVFKMTGKRFWKMMSLCFLFWCLSGSFHFCVAVGEKDPIKDTQSGVVPVTDELLTREGEPGPASPSFKATDTSIFLVKKPYEGIEKHILDGMLKQEEKHLDNSWDDWFLGTEESENTSASEPIDKK